MIYQFDEKVCLNGWWDFLPGNENSDTSLPPREGWIKKAYLVPSWFKQFSDICKKKSDKYYLDKRLDLSSIEDVDDSEIEYLFNTMDYPNEWNSLKSAWAKRLLSVEPKPGKRYFIVAEGTSPSATLFINGKPAAKHRDPMLPMECDITQYLKNGDNEIAFLMEGYDLSPNGKRMWPSGNMATRENMGLWQNIYLVEKNEVYLEDVIIITSVREKTLTLKYTVKNDTGNNKEVTIVPNVTEYPSNTPVFDLPAMKLIAAAGSFSEIECCVEWENPKLWDVSNPNLYWLKTQLRENDKKIDQMTERFGFREIWIDGYNIMLNGHIQRLYYDWGHKVTQFNYTEGWLKKWFWMIRDFNMNGSRLHTHPHPRLVLDLADEYGILITCESAIHGSGRAHATDHEKFWTNAENHIRNFVKRDKNHPSVILWSCENEMRYNMEDSDLTLINLPKLRGIIEDLDTSRPAYHDGDSSLWDEKEQTFISRHYYKTCSGLGWWDKSGPLHCGEMGNFHYQSPLCTTRLAGDAVWGNYRATTRSACLDAAMIIEDARSNDVCCLGPWNLSNLLNLRYNKDKYFEYDDFTIPGIKPLRAKANTCEFNYWEEGKGYVAQPDTMLLKNAFRPFAVIDTSRRTSFYSGKPFCLNLHVVNDTDKDENAVIQAKIIKDGKIIVGTEAKLYSKRGTNDAVLLQLPACTPLGECQYVYSAVNEEGLPLDEQKKNISIDTVPEIKLKSKIAVIGEGFLKQLLDSAGADYRYVGLEADLNSYDLLIFEKNSVKSGTNCNVVIRNFAEKSKKVLILEQTISPFTGLSLEQMPVQAAFISDPGHPLLEGMQDSDLSFWSDDAYSDESGDNYVAKLLYSKDSCSNMRPLLFAGEGEFGSGNYELTPLFEVRQKGGLIISCQMDIDGKMEEIPAAAKLLSNLLMYADSAEIAEYKDVLFIDADNSGKTIEEAISFAKDGGDAVIWDISPDTAESISKITGVSLELEKNPDGIWNAVKSKNSSLTAGIHNSDLCGISRFQYMGEEHLNRIIAKYSIKHAGDFVPIVETIPESAMCALYIHGGKTEPMRAYTATKYCYENKEPHETLIGYINYGKGRVFVSTFTEKEEIPRTARVKKQLLLNLGAAPTSETLLDGERLPKQEDKDGIPKQAYFISSKKINDGDLEKMLGVCSSGGEKPPSEAPKDIFPFEKRSTVNSEFLLSRDSVYVYYQVYTPVSRIIVKLNQDIPDPLANTYLNMQGNGGAKLWVNGKWFGDAKGVRFSEIGLEKGWNQILIRWTPGAMGVPNLKMLWENINGRPEDTFRFK